MLFFVRMTIGLQHRAVILELLNAIPIQPPRIHQDLLRVLAVFGGARWNDMLFVELHWIDCHFERNAVHRSGLGDISVGHRVGVVAHLRRGLHHAPPRPPGQGGASASRHSASVRLANASSISLTSSTRFS